MKVVFYKDQAKFTVANVSIPNLQQFNELLNDSVQKDLTVEDLRLYDFRITSTRGVLSGDEEAFDDEIAREIEEGINWKHDTVN